MMDTITIKREFCIQNSKIRNFQKKITHLEKNKQFRFKELDKMPETRQAIKEKAKELYDKSDYYREKGFNRKSLSYMNQASVVISELDSYSRFRKRKEIHRINHSIRDLEGRINPLQQEHNKQVSIIKDALFREFLGGL